MAVSGIAGLCTCVLVSSPGGQSKKKPAVMQHSTEVKSTEYTKKNV